jgi:DNA-binding transcriptional LysR family regulator
VTLTAAGEVLVAHGRALLDRQRVALTELRRAGQWPR